MGKQRGRDKARAVGGPSTDPPPAGSPPAPCSALRTVIGPIRAESVRDDQSARRTLQLPPSEQAPREPLPEPAPQAPPTPGRRSRGRRHLCAARARRLRVRTKRARAPPLSAQRAGPAGGGARRDSRAGPAQQRVFSAEARGGPARPALLTPRPRKSLGAAAPWSRRDAVWQRGAPSRRQSVKASV
ncbi:sterile alpha motif domain-containing protein 1-like [Alligator mississippiensis]|uniref:sterile alpha motif domain-containing protein 1-like n=1 Tax=Alligator mississippiensis TaxID=8496 RepID=UPI0028780654|nr:sterile alpha motif domain-containing protein 1-like [Alligator mississippiensis]